MRLVLLLILLVGLASTSGELLRGSVSRTSRQAVFRHGVRALQDEGEEGGSAAVDTENADEGDEGDVTEEEEVRTISHRVFVWIVAVACLGLPLIGAAEAQQGGGNAAGLATRVGPGLVLARAVLCDWLDSEACNSVF